MNYFISFFPICINVFICCSSLWDQVWLKADSWEVWTWCKNGNECVTWKQMCWLLVEIQWLRRSCYEMNFFYLNGSFMRCLASKAFLQRCLMPSSIFFFKILSVLIHLDLSVWVLIFLLWCRRWYGPRWALDFP